MLSMGRTAIDNLKKKQIQIIYNFNYELINL